MAKNIVVTIARQFGAEGREIGSKLAKRMGVEIYDKDILEAAASHMNVPASVLADLDESRTSRFFVPYANGLGIGSGNFNDKLFESERTFIKEIARKESCVIVGRLGNYILRDHPDCLHVYIFAPLDKRIQIVSEKHGLSDNGAKRLIKKMDMVRKDFCSYYTDSKWDTLENNNILLDRNVFGVDGCVDILYNIVKGKRENA